MLIEIGRVAVFIICAQTLLHFRAKESYEKYIKLLISMMILLLFLKPFFNGGIGKEGDILAELVSQYEDVLGKGGLIALEQEDIEAVAMNITREMVCREEVQEAETQGVDSVEITGNTGKVTDTIHVETIQIGD